MRHLENLSRNKATSPFCSSVYHPSSRHHCDLPVGSLQPSRATRTGSVRDHLTLLTVKFFLYSPKGTSVAPLNVIINIGFVWFLVFFARLSSTCLICHGGYSGSCNWKLGFKEEVSARLSASCLLSLIKQNKALGCFCKKTISNSIFLFSFIFLFIKLNSFA